MKRILLLTGKFAEKDVKSVAESIKREYKKYNIKIDVLALNVEIAAFITTRHVEEVIKKIDVSLYDLILLPGNAKGDWKKLELKYGIKIRLGSIHATDLYNVLKYLIEYKQERSEESGKFDLSHEVPACKLLSSTIAEEIIETIEKSGKIESENKDVVDVGNVTIGKGRMKIVAEIVNSTELEKDELIEKIDYYLKSGADVIDIGIPIDCEVGKAVNAVKIALDCCDAVSVDTFNPKIIEKCVKAGVHMIMSVSWENLKALESIKNQAVVLVDRDVENLIKLVKLAKSRGKKAIADCILDAPISTFKSMLRYSKYRELDSKTPIFFGAGNVTELCDADSIGINAILAFIGEEIGVDALFTTEASPKTRGSIRELRVASYMARASKLRNSPPKDFGFNLLVLKDKININQHFDESNKKLNKENNKIDIPKEKVNKIINAELEHLKFVRDPMGDFRIYLEPETGYIVAIHDKHKIVIKGNAENISKAIVKYGLVSRLDHAAYLGRELMKAEIALKLEKNYIQDEDLDFGVYSMRNISRIYKKIFKDKRNSEK